MKWGAMIVVIAGIIHGAFAQRLVPVTLQLHHVVGEQPLETGKATYQNALHQQFSITSCKYYLSHFRFQFTDGKTMAIDTILLCDVNVKESLHPVFQLASDQVTDISFIIGIDSTTSCSGLQEGALDPLNGMYWAWNTGYIFFRLDGYAPLSTQTAHMIEYHIGGFREPVNALRTIHLLCEKPGQPIIINVNILKALDGPNQVDFRHLSSVTDLNHATPIADNFVNMFSISLKP